MLDNQYAADRIRVTPTWRNGPPRYDYVIYTAEIVGGRTQYGYAQVLSLFTITLAGKTYHIALILDLKLKTRSPHSRSIRAVADRAKASSYRFIMMDCFVRSIFVQPPPPGSNVFTINDLIDSDVFLRLGDVS
jgi:hypothetical protein